MDESKVIVYRQIGAKVAYYRTMRRMTQLELAKAVHISRSTLYRIEHGRYDEGISLSTLIDIAMGLHVELSQLTSFTEEEKQLWRESDVDI